MNKLYFVTTSDGAVVEGSTQYTEGQSVMAFVKSKLPEISDQIDQELAVSVYSKFRLMGYKVRCVTPPTGDA